MDLLERLIGTMIPGRDRPWRRKLDAALFVLVALVALGVLAYLLWN